MVASWCHSFSKLWFPLHLSSHHKQKSNKTQGGGCPLKTLLLASDLPGQSFVTTWLSTMDPRRIFSSSPDGDGSVKIVPPSKMPALLPLCQPVGSSTSCHNYCTHGFAVMDWERCLQVRATTHLGFWACIFLFLPWNAIWVALEFLFLFFYLFFFHVPFP